MYTIVYYTRQHFMQPTIQFRQSAQHVDKWLGLSRHKYDSFFNISARKYLYINSVTTVKTCIKIHAVNLKNHNNCNNSHNPNSDIVQTTSLHCSGAKYTLKKCTIKKTIRCKQYLHCFIGVLQLLIDCTVYSDVTLLLAASCQRRRT